MVSEEKYKAHLDEIKSWVKELRFHKKIIGGIDENEVLEKMNELNNLYEKLVLILVEETK